jgi:hypothetical protein
VAAREVRRAGAVCDVRARSVRVPSEGVVTTPRTLRIPLTRARIEEISDALYDSHGWNGGDTIGERRALARWWCLLPGWVTFHGAVVCLLRPDENAKIWPKGLAVEIADGTTIAPKGDQERT